MSKRVLIIDDEAEIRRNLTFGLTQEGFTCTACPDGISAIHELSDARDKGIGYDYLVTDIFMPDIDGLKILKVIKQGFPDLPVLVITGFGDEQLKSKALAEHNTGYLDKPFEISDLVGALEELKPGATTLAQDEARTEEIKSGELRESVSSYMTIRITEPERSLDIFGELSNIEGVASIEAVRGDVDIILLAQGSSVDRISALFDRIKVIDGVDVVSMSKIERPKLDRDVNEFVDIYQKTVKEAAQSRSKTQKGATSYIIIDIEPNSIQQVFTTVFFIDEVIFCDVIDGGTKLVGMVTDTGASGKTHRVIERLSGIDGVLRVREAKIIKLLDV
ncbi:response regulator [bacterium]|nr:response regulator [bacterium]